MDGNYNSALRGSFDFSAREAGEGSGERAFRAASTIRHRVSTRLLLFVTLFFWSAFSSTSFAQEKIRIGYIGLSLSSLPLLAARELGFFSKNGLQVENLLLTFQLSSIAMSSGELDYVAGVG
ncbi:MAG: hypothetical protein ACREP5_10645, partial [Candidatus Binatia bacterium]